MSFAPLFSFMSFAPLFCVALLFAALDGISSGGGDDIFCWAVFELLFAALGGIVLVWDFRVGGEGNIVICRVREEEFKVAE